MKRFVLSLSCCCVLSFAAQSQNVANTFWLAYDQSNAADLFWHFSADTLYYSVNNVNWTAVTTFTESSTLCNLADIPSPPPWCGGTGIYSKVFSGDTLRLNIVADTCSSRAMYMATHYFVNTLTGIPTAEAQLPVQVMPNPSTGMFQLSVGVTSGEVIVRDIAGRIVSDQQIDKTETQIDLTDESPGIYFASFISAGRTTTIRLVKE